MSPAVEMRCPCRSLSVTVTFEVDAPSATMLFGEALMSEVVRSGGPATKSTLAVEPPACVSIVKPMVAVSTNRDEVSVAV
jgi:hypothetical protein